MKLVRKLSALLVLALMFTATVAVLQSSKVSAQGIVTKVEVAARCYERGIFGGSETNCKTGKAPDLFKAKNWEALRGHCYTISLANNLEDVSCEEPPFKDQEKVCTDANGQWTGQVNGECEEACTSADQMAGNCTVKTPCNDADQLSGKCTPEGTTKPCTEADQLAGNCTKKKTTTPKMVNFNTTGTTQQPSTDGTVKVTNPEREKIRNCGNPDNCIKTNPLILKVADFIDLLSAAVGVVVIGSIIVGGIMYSASHGDPQLVAKARSRIINAVIAFVAYIFVYAFIQWVIPGGVF